MRSSSVLVLLALMSVAGCRGPSLETRTFDLRHLDAVAAEQMIRPYVFTDRTGAPGTFSVTRGAISVRETPDNLERIAQLLAEHDKPPAGVRLHFQIIRANGASAPDSSIAAVEQQLRQLFRFRGYRLVAQGFTSGVAGAPIMLRLNDPSGPHPFYVNGELWSVTPGTDSGAVRMVLMLRAGSMDVINTQISVGIGQTMVLGGQAGDGPGAVILAVRAERIP